MWTPAQASGAAAAPARPSGETANPPPPATTESCNLQQTRKLIGLPYTPAMLDDLARMIGHNRIRVIRPGAVITSDHLPVRVNLILDDAGTLRTIRCG